jgi:hypothetical protein
MVVTPFVRGLLGLRADAANRTLRIAPQLPAAWDSLKVKNYRIGLNKLTLSIKRPSISNFRFEIEKQDDEPLKLLLAPALPALAKITRVTVDGKQVRFAPALYGASTVCQFEAFLKRRLVIEVMFKDGIEFDVPAQSAQIGERTSSLKVLDVTTPAPNRLMVKLEGLAGRTYTLRIRGGMAILAAQGGTLRGDENGWKLIEVAFPVASDSAYQPRNLELMLKETGRR